MFCIVNECCVCAKDNFLERWNDEAIKTKGSIDLKIRVDFVKYFRTISLSMKDGNL